ncbi:MAG: transposase [Deltaproteobacteria bacterium]|nr:transposase [Deltaproteobacteria bacterium]
MCRTWPKWKSALVFVKPETVLGWHRAGYREYWRWKSRGRPGRPRIPRRHIAFIRRISSDHPEWGEDRIALELRLKLGVEHSTSTIRRYMVDGTAPSSTWRSFLQRNASDIWALDFTTEVLWNFEVRHVLVVMALDTRRVVHHAVTSAPTLAWVKQQLRDAMPFDEGPRFLIHDNDGIFGQLRRKGMRGGEGRYRSALDAWLDRMMGVRGIPIPYGAPNANAHLERFMGTLRRECLNHFLFLSERQLRSAVAEFVEYYDECRPHQGIDGIPAPVAACAQSPPLYPDSGRLVARPILGGVHHDYRLAA